MSRVEPATQIQSPLIQDTSMRKPFKSKLHGGSASRQTAYRELIAGTSLNAAATVALPRQPTLAGRRLHSVWPASTRGGEPTRGGPAATGTDPTLRGADGAAMHLPGKPGAVYTLLQSPGFRLNGRVSPAGDQANVIDQVGLLLITSNGYSRVHVQAAAISNVMARVNGIPIRAGQSIRLADGGLLHAGGTGGALYIRLPRNLLATITRHSTRNGPLLGLQVSALASQVPNMAAPRTGLLAQSFQGPGRPRTATGDGEPYRGSLEELKVSSSLFGPSACAPQSDLITSTDPIGSLYQHYFDLAPERTFGEIGVQEIINHWEWINQQSVQLELIQNATARERKLREHERKQELLLAAALKGGNIDLAILLLAATETQSANDLTRRLVGRIHQLQQQRQGLSAQMAQVGQGDEAGGSSQLQSLVTRASNIATEISLLQTFLQDAVSSKRNIQEFASNWLTQSHQTTRSIIQSIGR